MRLSLSILPDLQVSRVRETEPRPGRPLTDNVSNSRALAVTRGIIAPQRRIGPLENAAVGHRSEIVDHHGVGTENVEAVAHRPRRENASGRLCMEKVGGANPLRLHR